ncbi:MAG: hypothetical protein Q8L48_03855 [Archangium sp.]|nr:hypothetical protein [Archangium sp.]
MTTALLLLTLANPGVPLQPIEPDLFQTSYLSAPGVLLPELAGSRGREVYGGVRQVVSGSICLGLGLAIGGGGLYSLISAANEMGSARTVFTVLGWTFFGIGAVLALVGIPLLVVGIVRLSVKPGEMGLVIGKDGQLAVAF